MMFERLILQVASIPPGTLDDINQLASELKDHAVLPVIGAGASVDCGQVGAKTLANELHKKMADGVLPLKERPDDFNEIADDLGKMADAIHLEHSADEVLKGLEFLDHKRWPSAREVAARFASQPHLCAYRVLARMAKERTITESVSFNYDCHFEGGLLREGFFMRHRASQHQRWPERYTVIANAESHAAVVHRGEFVVNKVHGCVETWRTDSPAEPDAAASAIILRWSQLLDWRKDWWSRDLLRDRARRHILVLVGFSALDPVIHSTLQAVMSEIAKGHPLAGISRLRSIDAYPNRLTLRMLLRVGRGNLGGVQSIQVDVASGTSLAATLFALHAELIRARIVEFAQQNPIDPAELPGDRSASLRRLAVSGPAMLAWTWAILMQGFGVTGFSGLLELGDSYYIPLCAEPGRTLRAFSVRDELAARYDVPAESAAYTADGSFLTVPRAGKAFMPLGLHGHEVMALADGIRDLTDIGVKLTSPVGSMDRIVVGRDSNRKLRAFSLETGSEVAL